MYVDFHYRWHFIYNLKADSFFNLFFAADNSLFISHLCPNGEIKKWLLADKTADRASFLTETVWYPSISLFLFADLYCSEIQ